MEITKLPQEYNIEFYIHQKLKDKAKNQTYCPYGCESDVTLKVGELYYVDYEGDKSLNISRKSFKEQFPKFKDRLRIRKHCYDYHFYHCTCEKCKAEWDTDVF